MTNQPEYFEEDIVCLKARQGEITQQEFEHKMSEFMESAREQARRLNCKEAA